MVTHTRTWAELEVSPETYHEIRDKLVAAGYGHAFGGDGEIDMNGIALVEQPRSEDEVQEER